MFKQWIAVLAVCCVPIGTAGCGGSQASAGNNRSTLEDVYGECVVDHAQTARVEVKNDIGGDVVVVAEMRNRVLLDYSVTGTGHDRHTAIVDADQAIVVTLATPQPDSNKYIIQVRPQSNPQGTPFPIAATDRVNIHLRVPIQSPLNLTTGKGNIEVAGPVAAVTAHTGAGDINVRGADGPLTLTTGLGSIVADGGSGKPIQLDAHAGNITVYSLAPQLTAHTTDGSILFIGDLSGGSHVFTTTGAGHITIAVPYTQTYNYYASSAGNQIVSEFFPGTFFNSATPRPLCILIENERSFTYQIDRVEEKRGRLEIATIATISPPHFISGTVTPDLLLFYTNRGVITLTTPYPHAVHIDLSENSARAATGPAGTNAGEAACQEIHGQSLAVATSLRLIAERGKIHIYHIAVQH